MRLRAWSARASEASTGNMTGTSRHTSPCRCCRYVCVCVFMCVCQCHSLCRWTCVWSVARQRTCVKLSENRSLCSPLLCRAEDEEKKEHLSSSQSPCSLQSLLFFSPLSALVDKTVQCTVSMSRRHRPSSVACTREDVSPLDVLPQTYEPLAESVKVSLRIRAKHEDSSLVFDPKFAAT